MLDVCANDLHGTHIQLTWLLLEWDWMSLGWCKDKCNEASFAFGVVLGDQCWCGDLVPNSSRNRDDCDVLCPRYDLENCGNPDTGAYAYIDTNNKPKGTAKANDFSVSSTVSDSETSTSSSPTTASPSSKASTTSSVSRIVEADNVRLSPYHRRIYVIFFQIYPLSPRIAVTES